MGWKCFAGALLLTTAVTGCETVQYTGRSQLNIVSDAQEKQLGQDSYQEVLKKTPLSTRTDWQTRVRAVGKRIQAAADKPDYQWEFNVLQGQEVNAFCLPGGKVAFWEGIMPVTQDESGVAVVMGHEVAHALARHGAERMSQAQGAQLVGELLSAGVGAVTPGMQETFMQLYGAGAAVGFILPWGRSQESEADHIGLILMAKAGYNPSAAIAFWERMSKLGAGQKPPAFLSTHPSDETRIEQIKQWLPEAMQYYKPR